MQLCQDMHSLISVVTYMQSSQTHLVSSGVHNTRNPLGTILLVHKFDIGAMQAFKGIGEIRDKAHEFAAGCERQRTNVQV